MSRPYWNYLDAEATMLEWTGYLNRGGTVAGWLAHYGKHLNTRQTFAENR